MTRSVNRLILLFIVSLTMVLLDKGFANPLRNVKGSRQGHIIDTVYVVIDKSELFKK